MKGIAVAPILFVVAILAVLVGALSSGSGGFGSGSAERAKSDAAAIIQTCENYKTAIRLLSVSRECDLKKIDWRPPNFPTGATWISGDYTGANGSNRSGTGRCALYHPNGGGLTYQQVQRSALADTLTNAYTTNGNVTDGGVNEDAFAGMPFINGTTCISGTGTCPLGSSSANATIIMYVWYLNYDVCKQINDALGVSWDPKAKSISIASSYAYGVFRGGAGNIRSAGDYVAAGGPSGASGTSEACAYDGNSNTSNSAFVYMCPMLIR